MQIPDGSQFGKVIARPGPMVNIDPNAYGAGVADAFTRAGAIGMNLAQDMSRLEAQRSKELENAQRQAQQARDKLLHTTVLSTVRNQVRDISDDVQRRMVVGEINPKDAGTFFDQQADEGLDKQLEGVPQEVANMIRADSIAARGESRNRVIDASVTQTRQLLKSDIMVAGEQLERSATTNRGGAVKQFDSVLDVMGPQAGMTPDVIQKEKLTFRERTAFNAADAMIRGNQNDQSSLDALQARFNTDEFNDLTPERRGQLEQKIIGRKQFLISQEQIRISRAEASAARHERQGERAINMVRDFIDSGGALDNAFVDQATKAVAGTSSAPLLTTMLRQSGEMTSFAQLAPRQQREELIRLRSKAAAGSNPANEKRLENFERIANATEKQLTDDPLVYGNRRNLIALKPIQFNGVDDLIPQLAVRSEQAGIVSAKVGHPVSLLMKDEAEKLATVLAGMPVPFQKSAVRMLASAMDQATGQALAKQINAKDSTLGLALFASVNATGSPRDAAELILKGADAVKAGRLKSASDDSAARLDHVSIARKLSEVPWATTQARDSAILAAQRAYDGLRDERNPSVSKAIAYTTGGLVEWAGSQVPIPHDWDERRFKNALNGIDPKKLEKQAGSTDVVIAGKPLSVATLAKNMETMRLIPVGVGAYALESGGQMVMTTRGTPLRINLKD